MKRRGATRLRDGTTIPDRMSVGPQAYRNIRRWFQSVLAIPEGTVMDLSAQMYILVEKEAGAVPPMGALAFIDVVLQSNAFRFLDRAEAAIRHRQRGARYERTGERPDVDDVLREHQDCCFKLSTDLLSRLGPRRGPDPHLTREEIEVYDYNPTIHEALIKAIRHVRTRAVDVTHAKNDIKEAIGLSGTYNTTVIKLLKLAGVIHEVSVGFWRVGPRAHEPLDLAAAMQGDKTSQWRISPNLESQLQSPLVIEDDTPPTTPPTTQLPPPSAPPEPTRKIVPAEARPLPADRTTMLLQTLQDLMTEREKSAQLACEIEALRGELEAKSQRVAELEEQVIELEIRVEELSKGPGPEPTSGYTQAELAALSQLGYLS